MTDKETPTKNFVMNLISAFSGQKNNITINRAYITITGSIEAALLLSQIIYWSDRTIMQDGWFAHSYAEWTDEITLSKYQTNKAIQLLKPAGVETMVKKFKGAPTVHYRLNKEVFSLWIVKKLDEPGKLKNFTIESEETEQSSTEIRTETIQKIENPQPPQGAKVSEPLPAPQRTIIATRNFKRPDGTSFVQKSTAKPQVVTFPKSVKRWKQEHYATYHDTHFAALDVLARLDGLTIDPMHRWVDLYRDEKQRYVEVHQKLQEAGLAAIEYGELLTFTRRNWATAPITEMPKNISKWKADKSLKSVPESPANGESVPLTGKAYVDEIRRQNRIMMGLEGVTS